MQLSPERLLKEAAVAGTVLGIDTGGPVASLGVVVNGIAASCASRASGSHAFELPSAVEEVLHAAKVGFGDLKAIAVAIGPGSFTGLRVGLSYAKGIAAAARIAIVGVSSLDALALCASTALVDDVSVYPLIDARRGEVYTGLYRFAAGALQRDSGDLVLSLPELISRLQENSFFVGDFIAQQACSLARTNGRQAAVVESARLDLRGSFVALIGAARVARKETDNIATLEPVYLRPADSARPPSLP
jgi:tRNA threonylcarbamoyladenosine biosynthesis protein TsaB